MCVSGVRFAQSQGSGVQRQPKNLRTLLTPIRFDPQRSIYPRFLCIFSLCIIALFVFVLFCCNLMHVRCFGLVVNTCAPLGLAASVCGAGHEKRRGEQLKWSWHLGCTSEVFHVHSYQDQFIQPGWAECVFFIY